MINSFSEYDTIKQREYLLVNIIQDLTLALRWEFCRLQGGSLDIENKVDCVYSQDGKEFGVQLKIKSAYRYEYNDIDVSINEIEALKDLENYNRFQLEVILNSSYKEMSRTTQWKEAAILDYKLLNQIASKIEYNPNHNRDLIYTKGEKVSWGKYKHKNSDLDWYVKEGGTGWRFRENSKGTLSIPYCLKINGKNLCKVYKKENERIWQILHWGPEEE